MDTEFWSPNSSKTTVYFSYISLSNRELYKMQISKQWHYWILLAQVMGIQCSYSIPTTAWSRDTNLSGAASYAQTRLQESAQTFTIVHLSGLGLPCTCICSGESFHIYPFSDVLLCFRPWITQQMAFKIEKVPVLMWVLFYGCKLISHSVGSTYIGVVVVTVGAVHYLAESAWPCILKQPVYQSVCKLATNVHTGGLWRVFGAP